MDEVSRRTLAHYDQRAEDFWQGTRDHDVRQNMDALLKHIEGVPPFTILDFGSPPGGAEAAMKFIAGIPLVKNSAVHSTVVWTISETKVAVNGVE